MKTVTPGKPIAIRVFFKRSFSGIGTIFMPPSRRRTLQWIDCPYQRTLFPSKNNCEPRRDVQGPIW